MTNWQEYVRATFVPGVYGTERLARDTGVSRASIRRYIDKIILEGSMPEPTKDAKSLLDMLKRGGTIESIAGKFGASERITRAHIEDLRDKGYCIDEANGAFALSKVLDQAEAKVIDRGWKGEKIIRFGLCGDNQENSKYTQNTHLHNFYDILVSEGITEAYHTGDIDEGEQMRPGHQYENYAQGADEHVGNIIKNYPRRNGLKTFFITGNHDHSIIKHVGFDIGHRIASERPDVVYLGASAAIVNLTPNCTLELRHPLDGTAYALSYKIQKMIEAMSSGEKPNILAVGHYHKVDYMLYRNVHAIQTGCFQAQTPWMRGKGISAHMGGWIVEAHVDEDGTITRFKPELIPYYKAIKDDWKNWI